MFSHLRQPIAGRVGRRLGQVLPRLRSIVHCRTAPGRNNRVINAVFGLGGAVVLYQLGNHVAESCGIVGYVEISKGNKKQTVAAVDYLMEGIHILMNRGYDSAGICSLNPETGNLVTTKFASKGATDDCVAQLAEVAKGIHAGHSLGIAHTRWATHGGKTDENAHPHSDYKNRISLVHNGTIENSEELREELEGCGIPFKSETDTEVISNLIGHYLDRGQLLPVALKSCLARLEGTWGLAIISKDQPHQIIAARHGSPLVVGVSDNKMFVASELAAFTRHTSDFIALKDGEVAIINAEGGGLDLSRVEKAPDEVIELSPKPFPHWTIKEIMEQPKALARCLGHGSRFTLDSRVKLGGMDENREKLLSIKNLVIAACGTSHFAGLYGGVLMRSLKAFDTVQSFDAAEVTPSHVPRQHAGLLAISQSGETKDTIRALDVADTAHAPCFSVINQVGSYIARTTGCGVYVNAGREHAVASTKAFTTQVTALAMIAAWFAQNRNQETSPSSLVNRGEKNLITSLHRLPVYCGIALGTHNQCKKIAKKMEGATQLFILGKGPAESIAYEGALKFKEITYVHAEGFGGGALKHGPFALLEKGTPVIMLIFNDLNADLMRIAASEVRARGAEVFVVTDKTSLAHGVAEPENVITIPENGPLTSLLAVVPLQLMAYELAILKGINPDRPRHLAKTCTTD